MPADLTATSGQRRERFVGAVADAMRRPLTDGTSRRSLYRHVVAVAAGATLLLLAASVVFARGSIAARLAGLFPPAPVPVPTMVPSHDVRASSPAMPSPSPDARSQSSVERVDSTAPVAPGRPSDSAGHGHRRAAVSTDSELANQNRLFASAMNVRERGDPLGAVRILEDFVHRYPASPLAQDAYVERFRTLAQIGDRDGAARAARSYLTMYRNGFARDEARTLVIDPER